MTTENPFESVSDYDLRKQLETKSNGVRGLFGAEIMAIKSELNKRSAAGVERVWNAVLASEPTQQGQLGTQALPDPDSIPDIAQRLNVRMALREIREEAEREQANRPEQGREGGRPAPTLGGGRSR